MLVFDRGAAEVGNADFPRRNGETPADSAAVASFIAEVGPHPEPGLRLRNDHHRLSLAVDLPALPLRGLSPPARLVDRLDSRLLVPLTEQPARRAVDSG